MSDGNGITLVDSDSAVEEIQRWFAIAHESTNVVAKALRDIEMATRKVKAVRVRCSCGRFVKLIDIDSHNRAHNAAPGEKS